MDNTENNSWDEISNDVSEIKKKIKDKVVGENSIDDLKDSFQLTLENSKEILKNPEKYFTEKLMHDLNIAAETEFKYGSPVEGENDGV